MANRVFVRGGKAMQPPRPSKAERALIERARKPKLSLFSKPKDGNDPLVALS